MHDDKDVTYRSRVDGVAHACGHDVHTAVLVGAARVLVALAPDLDVSGTVRLVFEPAEESVPGGAVDVIAEGWLDGVSSIYGLHCNPKLDVGQIGCRTGAISSAADLVEVRLRGPGGHTARPQRTVDLVDLLGRLITGLQPALDALTGDPGVLQAVFGAVHAGDAANVIPATARCGEPCSDPRLRDLGEGPRAVRAGVGPGAGRRRGLRGAPPTWRAAGGQHRGADGAPGRGGPRGTR